MAGKIRLGVFGGRRGGAVFGLLAGHPDAELVAVCEGDPGQLQACRQVAEGAGFSIGLYSG
jgi:predicted dehydrogenase